MGTISGVQWPGFRTARLGPWEYGGNLFVVLYSPAISVHKSTDGGSSWSSVATAGVNDPDALDVVRVEDVLYIASASGDSGFAIAPTLGIRKFDLATETMTSVDVNGPTVYANVSGKYPIVLTARSSTEFIVLHNGPTQDVGGTLYRRAVYSRYVAGAWETPVDIGGAGQAEHWDARSAVLGSDGARAHFVYTRNAVNDLFLKTLTSANSLGAEETSGVSELAQGAEYPIGTTFVDSGGRVVIPYSYFFDINTSALEITGPTLSRDGAGAWYANDVGTSAVEFPGAAAELDGVVYVFYVPATPDDVWVTNDSDGGFHSGSEFIVGTVLSLSVGAVTGGIGVLYDDNGTITYKFYYLGDFQHLRPDGDVAVVGWTDQAGGTTSLFSAINEVTADDVNYVKVSP